MRGSFVLRCELFKSVQSLLYVQFVLVEWFGLFVGLFKVSGICPSVHDAG